MRNILLAIFLMMPSVAWAVLTPATNISSTVPGSAKCLTLGDTNVQAALNALDQCSGGGGTPGGSDQDIQVNKSGAFYGDSGLTYNYSTYDLVVNASTPANQADLDLKITYSPFNITDDFSAQPDGLYISSTNGLFISDSDGGRISLDQNPAINGGTEFYDASGAGLHWDGSGNVTAQNNFIVDGTTTIHVTGSTQCLHVNSSGVISGSGSDCGSGSGAVSSVSNSDGTLTISPTTGSVVASLALGNANTWTGLQTFQTEAAITSSSSTPFLNIHSTASSASEEIILKGDVTGAHDADLVYMNSTNANNSLLSIPDSGVFYADSLAAGGIVLDTINSSAPIIFGTGGSATSKTRLTIDGSGGFTFWDGGNFILGTSTGTKIGTSTSQKLAFYNSTPIVQPTGNVCTSLQNLGLIASCTESGAVSSVSNSDGTLTISPTTGAVVASLALGHANTWTATQTLSAANLATDTTTGMKIGTATSQKLAFYNSTPVVQQTGVITTALSTLGLIASPVLPNPSASTLGGIESIAAVSHKWISTISTAGVPTLSQPAFSDISSEPWTLSSNNLSNNNSGEVILTGDSTIGQTAGNGAIILNGTVTNPENGAVTINGTGAYYDLIINGGNTGSAGGVFLQKYGYGMILGLDTGGNIFWQNATGNGLEIQQAGGSLGNLYVQEMTVGTISAPQSDIDIQDINGLGINISNLSGSDTWQINDDGSVNFSSLSINNSLISFPSGAIVGTTDSQTISNKLMIPSLSSTSGSATTATVSSCVNVYEFSTTATSGTLTIQAPGACSPTDGQTLELKIFTTHSQTYSFNSAYASGPTATLPTTSTTASEQDLTFQYTTQNSLNKWLYQGNN